MLFETGVIVFYPAFSVSSSNIAKYIVTTFSGCLVAEVFLVRYCQLTMNMIFTNHYNLIICMKSHLHSCSLTSAPVLVPLATLVNIGAYSRHSFVVK